MGVAKVLTDLALAMMALALTTAGCVFVIATWTTSMHFATFAVGLVLVLGGLPVALPSLRSRISKLTADSPHQSLINGLVGSAASFGLILGPIYMTTTAGTVEDMAPDTPVGTIGYAGITLCALALAAWEGVDMLFKTWPALPLFSGGKWDHPG